MSITKTWNQMRCTRVRYNFAVQVQALTISTSDTTHHGDAVSVVFERGNKHVSTGAVNLEQRKGDVLEATFNQTLSMDATMFQESATGHFTEKMGKLIVRQRVASPTTAAIGPRYKTLGVAFVQLHTLLNAKNDNTLQLRLPLQMCPSERSELTLVITCRVGDSQNESDFSVGSDRDRDNDSQCNSSIASTSSFRKAVGTSASAVPSLSSSSSAIDALKQKKNGMQPARLTATAASKPVVPPAAAFAPSSSSSSSSSSAAVPRGFTHGDGSRATPPAAHSDDAEDESHPGSSSNELKSSGYAPGRPAALPSLGSLQLPKNRSSNGGGGDDDDDDDEWQPEFPSSMAAAKSRPVTTTATTLSATNGTVHGNGTLLPPPPKDANRAKTAAVAGTAPSSSSTSSSAAAAATAAANLNKYQQFLQTSPPPPVRPAPVVTKGGPLKTSAPPPTSAAQTVPIHSKQDEDDDGDDDDGDDEAVYGGSSGVVTVTAPVSVSAGPPRPALKHPFPSDGPGALGQQLDSLRVEVSRLREENAILRSRAPTGGGGWGETGAEGAQGLREEAKAATAAREAAEADNRRLLQEVAELRIAAAGTARDLDGWKHLCTSLRTKLLAFAARLADTEVQLAAARPSVDAQLSQPPSSSSGSGAMRSGGGVPGTAKAPGGLPAPNPAPAPAPVPAPAPAPAPVSFAPSKPVAPTTSSAAAPFAATRPDAKPSSGPTAFQPSAPAQRTVPNASQQPHQAAATAPKLPPPPLPHVPLSGHASTTLAFVASKPGQPSAAKDDRGDNTANNNGADADADSDDDWDPVTGPMAEPQRESSFMFDDAFGGHASGNDFHFTNPMKPQDQEDTPQKDGRRVLPPPPPPPQQQPQPSYSGNRVPAAQPQPNTPAARRRFVAETIE